MKIVPLGDLAQFVSGGTPARSRSDYYSGSIPWITGADIGEERTVSPRLYITDDAIQNSATHIVPSGAIVLVTRTSVGKVAILSEPTAISQDITGIIPSRELDPRYAIHFLRKNVGQLVGEARGATIKGITRAVVEELPVPLPPLGEQRRIAAILDKADALRAKRRQILAHLDDLTQSIFHDMFGDSAAWFGRWGFNRLGDIAESVQYGTSAKAGDRGVFPVLRMNNVTVSGHFDPRDLKYLDLPEKDIEKYTVRKGDLLFNRTNSHDLVGKTAQVDSDVRYAFAGYLVRIRLKQGQSPTYVSAFLNSPYGKSLLFHMAKPSISQANISASELKKIEIPNIPLPVQEVFTKKVDFIKALRGKIQSDEKHDELSVSLQSLAFTGKLQI